MTKKYYVISSLWSGRYAKTKHGVTTNLFIAIVWFVSWTLTEFARVLRLNKYHYGNIAGIGKKKTDCMGRVF
jgi:hypothetical protein